MFLLPKSFLRVKKTKEKGYGVFAKNKIERGTVIGDYLGKIISNAEYNVEDDKQGLYLMYLSDYASIYPDLSKHGPHLVNHSCVPNCWIYLYNGHTLFYAIKDIEAGEELTISYLLSPNEGTCSPCSHACLCKSKDCTGTMHLSKNKYKLWSKFQNRERQKTKKIADEFGTFLPPLLYYPKTLPINPIYQKIYSV
ncbi:MAG: SET domain-containing protein [Candidatus Roizmanbacteria bacterium]|nr:SET domain-containing protein [Candidatus Roizmanbacteria bacterium]